MHASNPSTPSNSALRSTPLEIQDLTILLQCPLKRPVNLHVLLCRHTDTWRAYHLHGDLVGITEKHMFAELVIEFCAQFTSS